MQPETQIAGMHLDMQMMQHNEDVLQVQEETVTTSGHHEVATMEMQHEEATAERQHNPGRREGQQEPGKTEMNRMPVAAGKRQDVEKLDETERRHGAQVHAVAQIVRGRRCGGALLPVARAYRAGAILVLTLTFWRTFSFLRRTCLLAWSIEYHPGVPRSHK